MRSNRGNIFDAYLISGRKSVSAEEYIDIIRSDRDDVKSAKFVPPKIGSEGFGRFDIELTSSTYEVCLDR
ncbi:hypothetical protein JFT59_25715 [Pseudomonas sp. MF6784]|uniref:hypothetical protein n=1 Tax=Pseudomonas sp. MF6784 TaxID=2797535 RepID=UPI0018E7C772|nr:hypothetical protein [Pseudomonas sp. MF6784]MBJ2254592.1 hypothetical protein [Pseudomonas sp. MF6784]